MNTALTDETYWDSVWNFSNDQCKEAPPQFVTDATAWWREAAMRSYLGPGRRFLEIGVGGSPWPAHIVANYGAEAWGIDFSRPGLQLAARAVNRNHQLVHLVEGDLFDRTKLPKGAFHVVYSGGFVEHFPSPQPVMERIAELLAPDGVVVTTVPNLCGLNGILQKVLDRETFDRHVVIAPRDLDAAHAQGGLVPVEAAHFVGVVDFSCVNYARLAKKLPSRILRPIQFALAKVRTTGDWFSEKTNRDGGLWLAPMVGGVYKRAIRAVAT